MARIGIIGASGYTGAELLRLCARHPDLEVVLATGESSAGTRIAELYPSLQADYGDRTFERYEPGAAAGLDLVFLGLPHGASSSVVPDILESGTHVVDLAADFRLSEPSLYPVWYGAEHAAPELLTQAAYGLPELFRDSLHGAPLIAAAGCYPTAAALALAPLAGKGLLDANAVVVDAASGVSGAGREPKAHTTFCSADENLAAYGLLSHRHTPEIEQTLSAVAGAADGVRVLFTPHLVPMTRGILATCYARPAPGADVGDSAALLESYRKAYAGEQFVIVTEGSPATKATLGANTAHVTVRYDERTGWLLALCAIDNLVKGAAGQAVQCANLSLGLDEASGLPTAGLWP